MPTTASPQPPSAPVSRASGWHWGRFLAVVAGITLLFIAGITRLNLETDIMGALPTEDPVIADSKALLEHHPMGNQILMDIGLDREDPDSLVALALWLRASLEASGLFAEIGMDPARALFPDLLHHVGNHLPQLFTARDLAQRVAPLLAPEAMATRFAAIERELADLTGIGQGAALARDPLNLRYLALAPMAHLAPAGNVRYHRGHLLAADGRHLLLMARPRSTGSDTAAAREMTALMQRLQQEVQQVPELKGPVTLTYTGAFRAALDNETIIRRDVTRAVIWATLGIVILLLLAFPRPFIGLLALLPAVAGTVAALFVYSLWNDSLALMVLGFGGAVISITVDHGIAYLLFLDRPRRTWGREAAEEVRGVGFLAVLTTVGAFAALTFSGFPMFRQLGQFTALGISLAFIFVHTVFPWICPTLPAGPRRRLPLRVLTDKLAASGVKGALFALALVLGLALWARPGFDVNLRTMNTVSQATRNADATLERVWGGIFEKIYLMARGDSQAELVQTGDKLAAMLEADQSRGVLAGAFVPAMIFPGADRCQTNFAAWRAFWTDQRIADLRNTMAPHAAAVGFTPQAFAPFFKELARTVPPPPPGLPEKFYPLLGIQPGRNGAALYFFTALTPAANYDGADFRRRYQSLAALFDPDFFTDHFGQMLFNAFTRLLFIILGSVVLLLLIFFLDLKLTLAALLPVGFALACTLGTLGILNTPLGIPGLMLAIVVFGMGIDYALFFIRARQRYGDPRHPVCSLIRLAVLMAALSTMVGFGVLIFSEHTLLRQIGVTSLLGIAYALAGTFLILPPILNILHRPAPISATGTGSMPARILGRYRHMEAYPRIFARLKLRQDPMFGELPEILKTALNGRPDPVTILDVGCGFGVPGAWMLARYPGARILALEPQARRVRIAARVLAPKGDVVQGGAPLIPWEEASADLALMLDMIHYLDDSDLETTLQKLKQRLNPTAPLIIRATIPPRRPRPWLWWLEVLRIRLAGRQTHFRTPATLEGLLAEAGFQLEQSRPSGSPEGELVWLVARVG